MNRKRIIILAMGIILWITAFSSFWVFESFGLQTFNQYDPIDLVSYGFQILGFVLIGISLNIKDKEGEQ